jgi:hypothetical protein
VTPIRLVLILGAGLLFTDYKYGNGRLVESVSPQTVDLGYKFNNTFSQLLRRIAP